MIAEICYAYRKLKSVLHFIANYDFRCETPISILSYLSMNLFNEGTAATWWLKRYVSPYINSWNFFNLT